MNQLAPLPMALPLLGAAIALLVRRWRHAQRAVSLASLTGALAASVALLVRADRDGAVVARIGGWSPAIGISYVIDRFAATMLVISTLTLVAVLVFAIGEGSPKSASPIFHPVYLVLAAGVGAGFSTGDLFHLFVAFEILLMASYVLLTLDGDEAQVRSGTTYVVINTIESVVLLVGIGLVYAATGTLSMAELPARLATLEPGVRTGLQLLLLVAFGLKAAVFPLFFWLPDSYPSARSPVTAVFAGLLTKVGVYAIVRTQTLLFGGDHRTLLLYVAALTMVIGVLGAIAQSDVKRILSFHIVSQIGYMVFGVALGGPAAIAATIFFLVHQIPVKTSLFLVDGMIEHATGTSGLDRLSGLAHRSGLLAALFIVPALSLAGIPPFSGFVAKLGLLTAGLDKGQGVVVAVAIGCSLLTLVSMGKIWIAAFWGPATPPEGETGAAAGWPVAMVAATVSMVAVGVAIAVLAGPLFALCERTARDLVEAGRSAQLVAGR
jgi:multicomponent Na+:H+ antiporter subunit D